jgi:hypothetical protein
MVARTTKAPLGNLRSAGRFNAKVSPDFEPGDHINARGVHSAPRANVDHSGPMTKATVAKGHSVEMPTGERVTTGFTGEGKEVFGQRCKTLGPGSQIELPLSEVRRLQALGFLVDRSRLAPPSAVGPEYDQAFGEPLPPEMNKVRRAAEPGIDRVNAPIGDGNG